MALTSVIPTQAVGSATARSLRLLSIALVALSAYGADECASVADACEKDAVCKACVPTEVAPTTCATTATTCADWWAMACCTYGTSGACLESTLLLSHLQCLAIGNDCIIDGVCPEGSTDHERVVDIAVPNSDDTAACKPELTACMYDSECMGCLPDAVPEVCSAETATSICDSVSGRMCCLYGTSEVCLANKLLATYTDCVAEQSGCTIDRLCSGGQDGAEAVGTLDGTEGEDEDLDRSSGHTVNCAATLAFVLPMMSLWGVLVFV